MAIAANASIYNPQVMGMRNTHIAGITDGISLHDQSKYMFRRLIFAPKLGITHTLWPVSAVGSGLEAAITEKKKNDISFDNAKIVVESRDDDNIQVRVDITGEETQKAYDDVLTNLARTAPPVPGFRRMKGGKTSNLKNVPKRILLQMLGKDRVTKFLIQEIVSTTIGDFVEKENIKVKSQFQTIQTAEELELAFSPGKEFGFNATMEILKPETETDNTVDSDS